MESDGGERSVGEAVPKQSEIGMICCADPKRLVKGERVNGRNEKGNMESIGEEHGDAHAVPKQSKIGMICSADPKRLVKGERERVNE